MKQLISLAAPSLSVLKVVHIDPVLKGKHFEVLSVEDIENVEKMCCGVLSDLMEEDPYQLTYAELFHVWLIVKCSSLGDKLQVQLECPHKVENQSASGGLLNGSPRTV